MSTYFPALVAIWFLAFASSSTASERIDPAGIGGSLVISGVGQSAETIDQFFQLAQGKMARVVVLRVDSGEISKKMTSQLLGHWESVGAQAFEVQHVGDDTDPAAAIESINCATGVWLISGDRDFIAVDTIVEDLRSALHALLKRGGVVGGSGAAADAFGTGRLNLLPASTIDVSIRVSLSQSPIATALHQQPTLVGYEIGRDAALVIRGRRMRALGDGGVTVHLAASENRAAEKIELGHHQETADLTALRHSARARQALPFPAAVPPSPAVNDGTLIIIGGGGMPKGIVAKFVKLAGGDEASIVVLPTAVPDPVPGKSGIADSFRKAGAKEVTVLTARTLDKVDSEEYLKVLRKATGLWFGGGRQWRFADAYLDTKALVAMHGVLGRGGVVMGSSAGASIQADYLARANPLGNLDIMAEGYERGLGFIKGVAIDQHFAQRRRFKDMSSLVDRYPQLLGIGIDEGTALIVAGEIGTIEGASEVHFYDRRKPVVEGKPDYESISAGGQYNLEARKIVGPANGAKTTEARK